MTDTIQTVQALMENAEKDRTNLFRLIQMSPVAMAAFDQNMTYIEASPRWKEEMGLDSLDSLSYYDTVRIPKEWKEYINHCLSDGKSSTRQSGTVDILKNGKTVHVQWAISPWFIESRSARENGVVIVFEVVQDLVLAKDAALAASEQKSSFLANMSHELRTPLNGILGFTDILIRELSSAAESGGQAVVGPENYDLIFCIKESGESLLTLVNDILDFSKIEAGKMALDPRMFSLRQCLQSVRSLFDYGVRKKGLVLTTNIHDDVIDLVLADDSRLRQILSNLFSNALKFTLKGTIQLIVSVGDIRTSLFRFDVIDTGIGISEDRVPHLFKSFTQAGASTSRSYGGTGLGLAISKKLAVMMGGTMWVVSEFGKGSIFSFTINLPPANISFSNADIILPRHSGTARSETTKGDERLVGLAEQIPLKILAAEDNAINTKLLKAILKHMGYENNMFVENGQFAVDAVVKADAENNPYDIVLMDVQMPVMSGFDATRKIRGNSQIRQPKIVAVTASVLREEMIEAVAAGMDDHVSKPLGKRAIQDLFIKHYSSDMC